MKSKKDTKLREIQKQANNGGGTCSRCERKTDYLTVDHIVPLSIILLLLPKDETYDDDWNYQLLCRPCNQLKAGRLDFSDKRSIENLRKYIEKTERYYNPATNI